MPQPSTADLEWRSTDVVRTCPDGQLHEAFLDGSTLVVREPGNAHATRWQLNPGSPAPELKWASGPQGAPSRTDVLSALEAAFTLRRSVPTFTLAGTDAWPRELFDAGVLMMATAQGAPQACRDVLWQQPALWLPRPRTPMAFQYVTAAGRRHPRRPPKPQGPLYQRHIPWLGKTFSFRAVDIDTDLERFNRWMNDPAVAQIWEEEGDLDKHRRYLDDIAADPHIHAMIASIDGEPFGYFEAYWAKENRIGPFCDADDHDRGWHVLIGEPAFRGKAYATAWLTSISHYLFLDDVRTRRIVGEPRNSHVQQIRNLDRSGYAKVKEFDFPHKRALLVSLLRERYFADALWWPNTDPAVPSSPASSLERI